jgi:hypothetical protein
MRPARSVTNERRPVPARSGSSNAADIVRAPFASVPAALLERPRREDVSALDRDACAEVLDHQLRRLGRHDALCRMVLGRVAAALLDREAHRTLGFARLGDYTRERLGLSAREVQDAARVVRALGDLPLIAAAFEGGQLSWTQARLVVRVATGDDEARWLAIARTRTTRALEALMRATREPGDAARPGATPAGGTAHPPTGARLPPADDDALIDGEPAVRFRIRCPRRVRARWRRVVELARRMAGEQLATWQAVEAIAAEGLSGAGPGGGPGAIAGRAGGADGRDEVRTGRGADTAETRAAFGELDWSAIAEALPTDVAALARGLDGVGPHALDARLRALVRMQRRIDWQTGRLLRLFVDLRLPQALGFSSVSRYVRERLGISTRKAQALIAVERRTWQAPAFGDAYRAGTLSWTRALTVMPVLSSAHAAAWIARAGAVTVRRLADEVDWALNVQDTTRPYVPAAPPPIGARLEPGEAQMRARAMTMDTPTGWETIDADVVAFGPASVMGLLRAAVAAFAVPPEPGWRAFERLLAHVEATWTAQPRHRDPVFARDGWRCTVPACSGRRNLHDHHVLFRSRGGGNARTNRITVCAWHHLHGIHGRTVRAWGMAPDAVRWELGVRAGGPPLLRLVGDRYVGAARER